MKAREANLFRIIASMYTITNATYKLKFEDLENTHQNLVKEVYYSLGGRLEILSLNFGKWDIVTKDFIIELDEEQHFNRYRALSLESPLYKKHSWFNVADYKEQCIDKEANCLKKASRGGYWTNASTEKQFGMASIPGDFSGNGSPRWKQRAFYDFCRDLYSVVFKIPVYRLSIYDDLIFKGNRLEFGYILDRNSISDIKLWINRKIGN